MKKMRIKNNFDDCLSSDYEDRCFAKNWAKGEFHGCDDIILESKSPKEKVKVITKKPKKIAQKVYKNDRESDDLARKIIAAAMDSSRVENNRWLERDLIRFKHDNDWNILISKRDKIRTSEDVLSAWDDFARHAKNIVHGSIYSVNVCHIWNDAAEIFGKRYSKVRVTEDGSGFAVLTYIK